MTEYKQDVIKRAMSLEAEDWAKGVNEIHVHGLSSMYYDKWPEDTQDGCVTDTSFNNGTIVRTKNGKVIRVIGEQLTQDKLIDLWARKNSDKARILESL